jgi:hypothetical protein
VSRSLFLIVLGVAALSAAPATQTFRGVISDSMCAENHAIMRMGPTDAECTRACVVGHGALYVLVAGKDVYTLSDQTAPDKFAGQKVAVVGTLDAKTSTIQVSSITAAR